MQDSLLQLKEVQKELDKVRDKKDALVDNTSRKVKKLQESIEAQRVQKEKLLSDTDDQVELYLQERIILREKRALILETLAR